MQRPRSLTTTFLDEPPSCLQFHPALPNTLIIGTYLLSETSLPDGTIQQSKTGSLQRWTFDAETHTLSLVSKLPLPYAVFDLHFHPRDPSLLAISTSAASVALFKVPADLSPPSTSAFTYLWTRNVHEDLSIPALFLAWTPSHWLSSTRTRKAGGDGDDDDGFAVTFSDGRTTVFGRQSYTNEKGRPDSIRNLGSHDATQAIEVWFVALAAYEDEDSTGSKKHFKPFMFTGNDFGSLHTRCFGPNVSTEEEEKDDDDDEEDQLSPLLLDYDDRARHHTAGVTAILPLPVPLAGGAPLLLTGSYDEYLRVYHATRRGAVLAETCLGGGVWRLQLLKTENAGGRYSFLVLASCMHAGARVVRVTGEMGGEDDGKWEMNVLAEFTEHESMNYASDVWKPGGGYDLEGRDVGELLFVSSSFYDRRVCVWQVDV